MSFHAYDNYNVLKPCRIYVPSCFQLRIQLGDTNKRLDTILGKEVTENNFEGRRRGRKSF